MARTGRPSVPTHLKLLRGNPGKRAINHDEPKFVGDLKDAPDWMSEEQKRGWDYAIENAPRGLLKRIERGTLAAYVVAEDMHRRAAIAMNESGMTDISPTQHVRVISSYVKILDRQAIILLRTAAELGFTPSSRSRIRMKDQTDDDESEENPFSQFG